MTTCPDPPNHPPREVIERLIDDVAWAKTCMLVSTAAAPGSPERAREMQLLREAVLEPRRVVDDLLSKGQAVPRAVVVTLRACELAIPELEKGATLRRTTTRDAP